MLSTNDTQLEFGKGEQEEEDVIAELLRCWQNEKHAPELLPHPSGLLQQIRELLLNQADIIDEQSGTKANEVAFFHKLYRLEMDRLRWMVSSLLQCRLQKLEHHWLFYLQLQESLKEIFLGPEEADFLQRFAALHHGHASRLLLERAGLGEYPGLEVVEDDRDSGLRAIPRLSAMVVARVRRTVGTIFVDEEESMTNDTKEGAVIILPYRAIRPHLLDGSIELI